MSELKYTEQHEWVRVEGDIATVGISKYASEQLGDVVYVELPEAGRQLERSGEIAVVESVKAASEVYSPISGEIIEVNAALEEEPATVNAEPTGKGWFAKVRMTDAGDLESLMDQKAYDAYVKGLG